MPAGFGPVQAAAVALDMPAPAAVVGGWTESPSTLRLPIGPFADGKMPLREAAGLITQRAYRMDDQRMTTLQLITPLLAQLHRAGYVVQFQCETAACGGFDFRYGMEVLPEPQMHVDLGDFRYVLATRSAPEGLDLTALLVSRSDDAGYVQVTTVTPAPAGPPIQTGREALPTSPAPDSPQDEAAAGATPSVTANSAASGATPAGAVPASAQDFGQTLISAGSVALDDLQFTSGSAALEDKDYASLAALAQWLAANPTQHVMLVGHTDAVGSLAANTALSLQRAQSVRDALVTKLGADAARIDAEGAGYLAPRASNETPDGRARNRRVEVVLTPTP